jgi:hypothetical protein
MQRSRHHWSYGRERQAAMALLAVLMGAAACGAESPTSGGSSGSNAASVCASDPRAEAYAVGLEAKATDGAVKIRFVDAMPAPPSKGNNTWTVQVLNGADQPIHGATIELKAFMSDHGHGSSTAPTVTPMGSNGTYALTPVDLFMPGIWEITFNVTPPQGTADAVVFTFCIDG